MWFDLGSWKLINHLEHHQLKKVHCGEEHAFAKPEIGAVQPVYKTSKCRRVGKVGHFGRMWRLGWGIQCFESSETSISKLGRCLSPDGLCPAGNGTAQRQKALMDTRQSWVQAADASSPRVAEGQCGLTREAKFWSTKLNVRISSRSLFSFRW